MKIVSENSSFHCGDHREQPYQYLLLKKGCHSKRLLCSECLYSEEKCEQIFELKESIPLSIALRSPIQMISQMQNDGYSNYIKSCFNICEADLETQFRDQIKQFEQIELIFGQIKQQLNESLTEYLKAKKCLKNEIEKVLDKCQFNTLSQLIGQLKEFNDQHYTDQYTQITTNIATIIDEMLKNDGELITKNIYEMQQNHRNLNFAKPNLDQYFSKFTKVFKEYEQFIESLNSRFQGPTTLLTMAFEKNVVERIESITKKKIKQKEFIYKGLKDGLNGDAFWSKVNGKRNLLMIFKSLNKDYVFGGYSPCQWQQNLNNWVQDDNGSSFLFSQSRNQIYPLKQDLKSKAIFCHSSYGPTFGGGKDLKINIDFLDGYSKLGTSYICNQNQNNVGDHLFGGEKPNISECEIFELTFQ